MNAGHLVTPEDVGRAGRGDLDALRRMRDYWLDLVSGKAVMPILPKDEALPQLELLAEVAASGSGEARDWITLLIAYQLRIETLQRHVETAEHFSKQAAEAGNVDALGRWTRSGVEFNERLVHYRAKVSSIVSAVLSSNDADGSAILVNALSQQADCGDERALPLLQSIMDSVTSERAQVIKAEVRRIERATEQ